MIFDLERKLMKKLSLLLLAAWFLPAASYASAAGCEYAPETVDPVSGEKIIRTAWLPIKAGTGPGMSMTKGSVRGISDGDATYLGVKIGVRQYHPIPPELGIKLEDTNIITKKGKFDPRLKPFVEELKNIPYIIPKGSALRITLEDRTTLVIRASEDFSTLGKVTMPQWDDNHTSDFRIRYRVMPRYVLDAEAIALLSTNRVASIRLELPDKYHYFGHRNLVWDDRVIAKKSMVTIQGALKCVL